MHQEENDDDSDGTKRKESKIIMKSPITLWAIKFTIPYLIIFLIVKVITNTIVKDYEGTSEYTRVLRVAGVIKYQFLMVLTSLYIYIRLVSLITDQYISVIATNRRQSQWNPRTLISLCKILTIIFLLLVHAAYLNYWFTSVWPTPYVWLAAICHGYYIHLIAFLAPLVVWEIFAYAMLYFNIVPQHAKTFLTRYKDVLLAESYHTAIALVLALLIGSVQFFGAFNYKVRHLRIPISSSHPQIQPTNPPFRIVVLSDIHMGGVIGKSQLMDVVEIANEQNADIIVIDGDLVDGSVDGLRDKVTPLANLQAKYGIYYVSGNHEFYYANYEEWAALLTSQYQIRVLDNEGINVNDQICLIGFDEHVDSVEGRMEHVLEQLTWSNQSACATVNKKPHILLAHNPRIAKYIVKHDETVAKVQLIIDGHIHAGQFYVVAPLLYAVLPFYWGWYPSYQRSDGIRTPHVYVSAGTHFWMVPMKMLQTAEITVLDIS